MRGIWALTLLTAALAGVGCTGKPKRQMRPPAVQMYDLPSRESAQVSQPPTYPEDKIELSGLKKSGAMPAGMGAGGMGGMPSPGMPGGPGGPGSSGGFRQ